MNTSAERTTVPSITARPSSEEKALFSSVATARGITESALALEAIRTYLAANEMARNAVGRERTAATDRITIRLRPGDGGWIAGRARARGMKSSGYLAALIRAHISSTPPLPEEEIRVFKRAVAVLVDFGRIIQNKPATTLTREDLHHVRAALEHIQKELQSFIKASLMAWESRID